MSRPGDEAVNPLREALKHSPDNVPLRRHLAETLLAFGRAAEAEVLLRESLAISPDELGLKVALAKSYLRLGRSSHALVVLEPLAEAASSTLPPAARVLYARALLQTGESERAASQYRRATEADASVADAELAEALGRASSPETDGDDPAAPGGAGDDEAGAIRVRAEPGASSDNVHIERPKVTFADVGGMERVKEEIRLKIIHPLEHPEIYRAYGKKTGGGILMYGPPGCGKTHLARATAGQVKAKFIAVGIADVLNMWLGESERNLRSLFEQARANTPCVLFFDEIDALGASRGDLRQSAGRQLVNQLLSELDGLESSNDGLLVLAATNAPWHLDTALRRPGRFDRVIFVPPPDRTAREQIVTMLLKGKPVDGVDAAAVAKYTDEFSGADLKNVVDLAVESKLREAMAKGVPTPLRTGDLTAAAKGVRPTTREWFSSARNYALYANQGGLYDEVLAYLKKS